MSISPTVLCMLSACVDAIDTAVAGLDRSAPRLDAAVELVLKQAKAIGEAWA